MNQPCSGVHRRAACAGPVPGQLPGRPGAVCGSGAGFFFTHFYTFLKNSWIFKNSCVFEKFMCFWKFMRFWKFRKIEKEVRLPSSVFFWFFVRISWKLTHFVEHHSNFLKILAKIVKTRCGTANKYDFVAKFMCFSKFMCFWKIDVFLKNRWVFKKSWISGRCY